VATNQQRVAPVYTFPLFRMRCRFCLVRLVFAECLKVCNKSKSLVYDSTTGKIRLAFRHIDDENRRRRRQRTSLRRESGL